ncbi:ribonuclease H-like protein [Ceratobasidium sp. AG-I]|nr:ribonuclease H-like protein [Ceratobasidium sp. AG-I]
MEPTRAAASGSRFKPARDHHIRRAPEKAPVNLCPIFEWRDNVVPGTQISYLRAVSEVNEALQLAEGPFGFDMEWKPCFVKGQAENPVALIQLAQQDRIYLIHLSAMSEFPEQLREVLEDPNILKVGVGIQDDAKKLWRDHGVSLLGVVELSHLARRADVPRWENGKSHQLISLTRLLEAYNSHRLQKGKIQRSNWELPLKDQQRNYAASDALAGFVVYQHLLDLGSQVHPLEYTYDVVAGRQGPTPKRPNHLPPKPNTYIQTGVATIVPMGSTSNY